MLVPIRHIRPHIGFVWLVYNTSMDGNSEDLAATLKLLMDAIEGLYWVKSIIMASCGILRLLLTTGYHLMP